MQRLSEFTPLIQSANIRQKINTNEYTVGEGIGEEGDIVLIEILSDASPFNILDYTCNIVSSIQFRYILSVLGNRDSSTHANGGIPNGGLNIRKGQLIDWLGGASGLIGICEESSGSLHDTQVEKANKVKLVGLLKHNKHNINVMQFALQPLVTSLSLPVILVAASSAEAGKTTLMVKIISILTKRKIKVAAIKATGTGGLLDCISYKNAGAFVAVDQVDCGLITTYTSPKIFHKYIKKAFLYVQEQGCDIIICEMGGDILWANNPTLLQSKFLNKNIISLLVINNDPLAMLGTNIFLKRLNFQRPVYYFSSPFRNYSGMRKRAESIVGCSLFNIQDCDQLELLLSQIAPNYCF